ncbi:hypothetical protein BTM25_14230 [Actinomadura rubteroloni]|uniref:Uncharacterized protein n=1 Tax=Actinomadura rubteroloni TaxID=1926885 RepID=A0A2P4UPN6_9ACTN|nr:Rv3235 family protein [Actinomadura rubteroloni]POM27015.1 hypothetical protein BTM25_14230 [Actinomadura rubteroloni]
MTAHVSSEPLRIVPGRPPLRLLDDHAAPPPEPAVRALIALVAAVLAGTCPPTRLARAVLPEIRAGLAARVPQPGRAAPPQVLTSWVQRPSPHAAEAGAVLRLGTDVRALALRLEFLRGRWRCVQLETTVPARRLARAA